MAPFTNDETSSLLLRCEGGYDLHSLCMKPSPEFAAAGIAASLASAVLREAGFDQSMTQATVTLPTEDYEYYDEVAPFPMPFRALTSFPQSWCRRALDRKGGQRDHVSHFIAPTIEPSKRLCQPQISAPDHKVEHIMSQAKVCAAQWSLIISR